MTQGVALPCAKRSHEGFDVILAGLVTSHRERDVVAQQRLGDRAGPGMLSTCPAGRKYYHSCSIDADTVFCVDADDGVQQALPAGRGLFQLERDFEHGFWKESSGWYARGKLPLSELPFPILE